MKYGDFTVETERLILYPLTPELLRLYVEDMPELERRLGITYRGEAVDGFFRDIVKVQAEITEADPGNYIWHTFWLIIEKGTMSAVGSSDFKDLPDGHGETEIGYGLGEGYTGHGYMTETVRAMCIYAFANGAKAVIAETLTDNLASQNVLRRCMFVKYREGKTYWWRLTPEDALSLRVRVLEYLRTVPHGRVVTYGHIAAEMGNRYLARAVGNILHTNPDPIYYPCYKVVNSAGKLAACFGDGGAAEQKRRLESDGVAVAGDRVDLGVYGYFG